MKVCPRCGEIFPDDAGFCPADGEELRRSADPYLGRTIASRYRLTKRLGAGGMSIVYLARHVIIDRLSAIKILREDLGSNPAHRERFLREARAVNRINHRNIVEITDVGESDGVAYLVMEYVSGESLLAHIQRGAFAWRRAVAIAQQIASALARAHQAGVIHRDLKPENIMIVPQEEGGEMVKITDFGIAKIMDAPALTFSEQLFGTPGYIAPEYVEGLAIDYRADLYSLGVVLYEMLSGTLPYDARGQADLLLKPLTQPPNPLSKHVQVPQELEALTMRLLQKKPEDRPYDAFVVLDELTDIVRRNTSQNPPAAGSSAPPAVAFVPSQQQAPREDLLTLIDPIIEVDPEALMPPVPASIRSLPPPPMEEPAPRMPSEPPPQTPNVGKVVTREMAHRWQSALAELRASIERARERGGKYAERAERATHLERLAAELVPRVERAAKAVAELQGRVDRLEAAGREFRASLGRAIDELSRDRSREHTQLEELRAQRDGGPTSSSNPPSVDARAWERGALLAEIERVTAIERDLGYQIDTLQKQLDRKNEEHAKQMLEASGQLEGAIAALRHLSGDLVRTLDEAIGIVSGGAPARR
jgi:serine/threonine-protein kinase